MMRVEVTRLWIPLCMADHPRRFPSHEFLKMFSCGIWLPHCEPSGSSKWKKNTWFIICIIKCSASEELVINRKIISCSNCTFKMSGSFHGPLSERIQPPLSAQVQVPPKISGNSLVKVQKKRGHLQFQKWSAKGIGKVKFHVINNELT